MTAASRAERVELSADAATRDAGAARAVLTPVAGAVAVLYAVLAIAHLVVIGGQTGRRMAELAAVSAVFLAVLAWVSRRGLPLGWANPGMTAVFLVVLANSSVHIALTGEIYQLTNLMLAVIAAGMALLARWWNWAVTALAWASAAVGIAEVGDDTTAHWVFAMLLATFVAQLARYGRRRSLATAAAAVAEIELLSQRDPLTGLFNRRGLESQADSALESAIEQGEPVTVYFVDVAGIKGVNDQYGQDAGDDVLRRVARALQLNARGEDVVGRWGGDTFIVVITGEAPTAEDLHDRLLTVLAGDRSATAAMWEPRVTVGSSRSTGPVSGDDLDQILWRADRDMYARRSTGP